MVRSLRPVALLVLAALLAGGFWASRPSHAQLADDRKSADHHEVSQKVWVTQQEIQNRYPLAKHKEFLRKAIANSRMAGVEKRTGGAFGAIITDRDGHVVGEGSNHVVSEFDPTWHGEMEAIRNACKRLKAAGYLIALDDFAPNDPRIPLCEYADIIKVDVRATRPE